MIETYEQARMYLESLIKPFHMERIEGTPEEYKNPYGRMLYLLQLLGNPHKKFPSVVVSGTSGKTSTTHYIAHLLSAGGYKVGMTISPHLQRLNERIQINGEHITDASFVELINEVKSAVSQMAQSPFGEPSYFETLLSCAFLYFAKQQVDIVVAEVGLESKYDGTNVLDRLVFVYTNTSLDHTQILGETVEAIASETVAGVIPHPKLQGAPVVVSAVMQESVRHILAATCKDKRAPLFLLGQNFTYDATSVTKNGTSFDFHNKYHSLDQLQVSMEGVYQAENAALAIEAVLVLKQFGYTVSENNIRQTLPTIHVPGRFEIYKDIILDGAHNPAKMEAFLHALKELYPKQKKIFILGFKEGKNIASMLGDLLEMADDAVITTMFHTAMDSTKNPSLEATHVYETVLHHPKRKTTTDVYQTTYIQEAIALGRSLQREIPDSILVVTGSLYLVGEARNVLATSHFASQGTSSHVLE